MGMDTYIVGFRPADEQWEKMKAIWQACDAAGIEPPEDVRDFFDDQDPGEDPGREVKLGGAATEFHAFGRNGYLVDIEALPKGVRYIRFYNSW